MAPMVVSIGIARDTVVVAPAKGNGFSRVVNSPRVRLVTSIDGLSEACKQRSIAITSYRSTAVRQQHSSVM
jgi:hypothetical protein